MAEHVQALKLTGMPDNRKVFEQGTFVYAGNVNEKPFFSCAFKFPGNKDFEEYSVWWVEDPGIFILGPKAKRGTGNGLIYAPGQGAADPTKVTMQWIVNEEEGDWKAAPEMRAVEAEWSSSTPKSSTRPINADLSPVKKSNPSRTVQAQRAEPGEAKPGGSLSIRAKADPTARFQPINKANSFIPPSPSKGNPMVKTQEGSLSWKPPEISPNGSAMPGRLPLGQLRTAFSPAYPTGSFSARGAPSSARGPGGAPSSVMMNSSVYPMAQRTASGVVTASAAGGYATNGYSRIGFPAYSGDQKRSVGFGTPVQRHRIAA